MTYLAEHDPNGYHYEQADGHVATWDAECPEWRTESVDPEDRPMVSYDDVSDPETGVIRGFGGDHRYYVPGAFGE
jgi:hypothetical protein